MKKILPILLLAFSFAAFLGTQVFMDSFNSHATFKNKLDTQKTYMASELRESTFNMINEKRSDFSDYSENSVVLLNFWANWCQPCLEELSSLSDYKDQLNNNNFKVLAVDLSENSNLKKSIKRLRSKIKKTTKFDFIKDDSGWMERFNISSLPYSILLVNGRIVEIYDGYTDFQSKKIQSKIQDAIIEVTTL